MTQKPGLSIRGKQIGILAATQLSTCPSRHKRLVPLSLSFLSQNRALISKLQSLFWLS